MTNIRDTQTYTQILADGEGNIRETQVYVAALGNAPVPEVRQTQAYQTILATEDATLRDTLTYFYVLANILVSPVCSILSVILPGPFALKSPILGTGPSFSNSLGEVGVFP